MQLYEVYALAGAVSLGTLAALYLVVWRARHERWSACFALVFALIALIYAFEEFTRPTGDHTNLIATFVAAIAAVLMIEGMLDYVALGGRPARILRAAAVTVALVLLASALASGLTRPVGSVVLSGYLLAVGCMAAWAMRREPRSGHGLVILAMLLYPGLALAAWWSLVPLSMLRYAVMVPLVAMGMTLLTTGLLRARRRADEALRQATQAEESLRIANESLEERVAQRTAELHDVAEALDAFNRHVAHDLRGPLGGIAGAARVGLQALQRGDQGATARFLQAIADQADVSVSVVQALLALARAGGAQYTPARVDVEAVAREAVDQVRLSDAGPPVPVTIAALPEANGDPDLLRQVFVNLLGNAIKFSRDVAAPSVEVGSKPGDAGPVYFVRDNGVGFDADRAAQLFQPFRRLHGGSFDGHGIGLSIVKRIVERHGGTVWAEAAPGKGATFYFTLGERGARGGAAPARSAA